MRMNWFRQDRSQRVSGVYVCMHSVGSYYVSISVCMCAGVHVVSKLAYGMLGRGQ